MSSRKDDKFYTKEEVAKMFVEEVDRIFPLGSFDEIIEPSAGSGSILKFLPEGSVGYDIEPESEVAK